MEFDWEAINNMVIYGLALGNIIIVFGFIAAMGIYWWRRKDE